MNKVIKQLENKVSAESKWHKASVNELPGAVEMEVARFLHSLVLSVKPQVVVEAGSACGYSTLFLAQALKDNGFGQLYSCDVVPNYVEAANERLRKADLQDICKVSCCSSLELDVDDIDFLFLDSDHSFENVSAEILHFADRLTSEAIICFHDAQIHNENGVFQAAMNYASNKKANIIFLPTLNGFAIINWRGIKTANAVTALGAVESHCGQTGLSAVPAQADEAETLRVSATEAEASPVCSSVPSFDLSACNAQADGIAPRSCPSADIPKIKIIEHTFDLGYIHHSNQELLKYFPNYDYHQPKDEYLERLKFSHPDNLVGIQQRCFNYYWASRTVWINGLLGVELGSGGMKTPYCLSTDIYDSELTQTELIVDGAEIPFLDNSIELLLANHVLEHIAQPIVETLSHWVDKLRFHGITALIVPNGKYCDVLAMDPTHKHATNSETFKNSFLTKLSKRIEIMEYDTLDNEFSFNIVFRKIE